MLIDTGTGPTFKALSEKILTLPVKQRRFELFVVSHIDDDHIGGSLELFRQLEELEVRIDNVWFNAFAHLEGKAIHVAALAENREMRCPR